MKFILIFLFLTAFSATYADFEAKKNFQIRKINSVEEIKLPSVQLNVGFGPFFVVNPGVQVSGQLAFRLWSSLYFGVEGNFTQYYPGSSLIGLGNLWYEFRVYGAPRFRLLLGLAGGYSFHSQQPLPDSTWAAFFETGVSEEIDEGTSLQGLLRPGYLGGVFAFLLQFKISFRF